MDQSGWLDRSCRKEEAVSTWLAETCYIFGDEISDTFIILCTWRIFTFTLKSGERMSTTLPWSMIIYVKMALVLSSFSTLLIQTWSKDGICPSRVLFVQTKPCPEINFEAQTLWHVKGCCQIAIYHNCSFNNTDIFLLKRGLGEGWIVQVQSLQFQAVWTEIPKHLYT